MTDRELLELAAKAAEYELKGEWFDTHRGGGFMVGVHVWNPLVDDADALRLAAKLQIDISFHVDVEATVWGRWADAEQVHTFSEPGLSLAATRRAIVRAAAELGRQAP